MSERISAVIGPPKKVEGPAFTGPHSELLGDVTDLPAHFFEIIFLDGGCMGRKYLVAKMKTDYDAAIVPFFKADRPTRIAIAFYSILVPLYDDL
jgi:hypothetical protein